MGKEEKESCRDCAYQRFNFFGINRNFSKWWTCRFDNSSIKENELDTKSCENYLLKKNGMTLEQQIEEHKQEQKRKQELVDQARIAKEHAKLSNRLKRNWYYVSALTIALITLGLAIWKIILGK